MTDFAMRVIAGVLLIQIHVWVVAGGTGQARILSVMAAAVKQSIGLEADITDAAEVRHHGNRIHTTMACPAEFLR